MAIASGKSKLIHLFKRNTFIVQKLFINREIRRCFSENKQLIFQNQHKNDIYHGLKDLVPAFPVDASKINFLNSPSAYFDVIKSGIATAKDRIVLTSLYLGNGKYEEEIVKSLLNALENNSKIKITILLDCLRGTRGSNKNNSSVSMLLPLLQKFPKNIQLSLYHTPELRGLFTNKHERVIRTGILKKVIPERVNELIGVQHTKILLFDDDLIITGANLSETYFTTSQDRYIHIKKTQELSEYFANLVDAIISFSYEVNSNGKLVLGKEKSDPLGSLNQFLSFANKAISSCIHIPNTQSVDVKSDTWIFPTFQMGVAGVKQDEESMSFILKNGRKEDSIYIASPYINLISKYRDLILNGNSKVNLVTAAPHTNRFHNAEGFSGYIPLMYSSYARDFYNSVLSKNLEERIKIREYMKENWTFHGKGIWYKLKEEEFPFLTVIGSGNLGRRSEMRDIEAQLVVITENKELQKKIEQEREIVFGESKEVKKETWTKERSIPWWIPYARSIFSTFM